MSRFIAPAFFAFTLLAAVAVRLLPHAGEPVAVFVWPSADSGTVVRVVAAAGGEVMTAGQGGLAVAQSGRTGFAARLYAAGALLVWRAQAAACGTYDGADPK